MGQVDNSAEVAVGVLEVRLDLDDVMAYLGSVPGIAYAFDPRGTVIAANEAFCASVGRPRGELVGHDHSEVLPPGALATITAHARDVLGRGTLAIAAGAHLPFSTGRASGDAHLLPLRGPDGCVEAVLFMAHATPDATAVEEALRDSDARYQTLFEASPRGMADVDLSGVKDLLEALKASGVADLGKHLSTHDGDLVEAAHRTRVLGINGALLSLLGADGPEELLARRTDILCHKIQAAFIKMLIAVAEDRPAGDMEVELPGLTGAVREFTARLTPFPGRERDWGRALIVLRDLTEERVAERTLIASEERYRQLFEESPIAMMEMDWSPVKGHVDTLKGAGPGLVEHRLRTRPGEISNIMCLNKVLAVNRAMLRFLEVPSLEAYIEGRESYMAGPLAEVVIDQVLALARGQDRSIVEGPFPTFKGAIRVVRRTFTIAEGHEATWSRCLLTIEDITELRHAELGLMQSEHVHRTIFEGSPVALAEMDLSALRAHLIVLRDAHGSGLADLLRTHTDELERMAGMMRLAMVNRAFLVLEEAGGAAELAAHGGWGPVRVSMEALIDTLVALVDGETLLDVEGPMLTGRGDLRWVHRRFSVVPGHEEDWARILVSIEDVSERRRAESTTRASEEKYRSLFEESQDAVLIADAGTGAIVEANWRAEELLGWSRSELLSRRMSDLSAPRLEAGESVVPAAAPRALSVSSSHSDALTASGERLPVEVRARIIEVRGQRLVQTILTHLTERREAERRAVEERWHAELYLDLLGHDVNNLLQGIMTSMELVRLREGDPGSTKHIDGALKQAKRIATLVRQVHRISTLSRQGMRLGPVDARPLLAKAVEDVVRSFPDRVVRPRLPQGDGPIAVVGGELLQEVFANILDNAVKHDRGPEVILEVSVKASATISSVQLLFDDNGPGVPDELKDRIFRRGSSRPASAHGFGLGLTLCDQIVRQSGGRIWVEDRVQGDASRGSRFVVELKRA